MNEAIRVPTISIVVPAYNEESSIAACLRSLAAQDVHAAYEVILVDNNCTDRTVQVARAAAGSLDLHIVRERTQGRGAARAAGFAAARGQVLCSADADTVYPAHWLRTFVAALRDSGPDVVAVTGSCRIVDLGPVKNAVFNVAQPVVMHAYRLFVGHYWLSGFSFAVRRDAYVASGGFDPSLNAEEDIDLSFKVSVIGGIRFVHRPVTFSGRRFRRGLVRGFLEYVSVFHTYRTRPDQACLSDVR